MTKVTVFVGLDYHQDSVQVCVMDRDGSVLTNRRCANAWEAIRAVVPRRRVRAAIEACSGASELAEELVSRAGWSVDLAHPGYVARMKQSPDKTDFGDARVLADLERVGYLPRVWLAPLAIRELRRLVRFRQQLAGERRNCKLRIRALLRDGRVKPPGARAWTVAWMEWLRSTREVSEQTRWILDRQLAHRLPRCSVRWARLNSRLRIAGKPGSVVAAAVANRWVRWLHHEMQTLQAA